MLKKASLLLLPLLLVSACSAGRHNPQFKESSSEDGVNVTVGGNAVRDVYIAAPAPKGGTARASVYLARLDPGSDILIGASSPVAAAVDILSAGQVVQQIPVAGTQAGAIALDLSGLNKAVQAASYYPITLSFATAGDVTLQVPVLRPGILAPGSTQLPTVVPDVPNGSTVPLQQRPVVPNTPHD